MDSLKAYRAGRKHAAMQRAVAAVIKGDSDAENIAAFYAIQPRAAAQRGQTWFRISQTNASLPQPERGQSIDGDTQHQGPGQRRIS